VCILRLTFLWIGIVVAQGKNKTVETEASVVEFIAAIEDEKRRAESEALLELMTTSTGFPAKMWGKAIIGFGSYHYKYESGREGDSSLAAFSPRKAAMSIYIMAGFTEHEDLMKKLGKCKAGKSCLKIKKLADVDLDVLQELVRKSVKFMQDKYPDN
jgi:hypothetical protein